ncbi:hypothetical protein DFH06DRAFT_61440 [Mycena polygramma]|nr:hypothetical protein DFH06DRAFT_61440 [Mycena polygramma]
MLRRLLLPIRAARWRSPRDMEVVGRGVVGRWCCTRTRTRRRRRRRGCSTRRCRAIRHMALLRRVAGGKAGMVGAGDTGARTDTDTGAHTGAATRRRRAGIRMRVIVLALRTIRLAPPPPPRPPPPTKRSGGPSPGSAAWAWAARRAGRPIASGGVC